MELNAAAPDRLLFLPHLATRFPDWCEAEVWRLARLGAKAVEFCAFDVARPIYDEVWEPVCAAAQGTGIPLCSHIGGRAGAPYPDPARGAQLAYFALAPFGIARPLTELVYCGALERFPGLRFAFAECRAGWIPFLVYWMDRQMRERPHLAARSDLKLKPSDYVRRQITVTFEEDDVAGMLFRHPDSFLADIAIWGADYPHEQGIWPNADETIDRVFAGIDPATRRRVLFEHACEFFRIDGPADGFAAG
jgi:predicted TIM-barrel fold metal-dependent hydrolase